MRVAVAGAMAHGHEAAAGLAAELATAAREAGAGLLVLPQLFLGLDEAAAAVEVERAEPCDGRTAQALVGIATRHRLAIVYGYLESCSGALYDSLLLIDEEGCCRTSYRRTHLRAEERPPLELGQWLSIMPLGERRLGFLIGQDVLFPEPARALRLEGCDTLIALIGRDEAGAAPLLAARAIENGCELVCASGSGPASCVLDAEGQDLSAPVARGLRLAELPAAAAAERIQGRRPRLYARISHAQSGAG